MPAEKKELTREDPDFLPIQYDLKKAQLAKLKKEYDPALIPEANEKGDEGYLVIHDKAMAIVKVRTRIDAKRKELKADALSWGRQVDSEAKRLTAIVTDLEKPWRDKKIALDEKEARAAEEERAAEEKRIKIIEAKVEQLKTATADLMGATVTRLQDRLTLITDVVIDELYGDYVEVAELHKANAIDALMRAIAERKTFEANQDQMEKNKALIEKQQEELRVQTEALDKMKQEKEAVEAEKQQRIDKERTQMFEALQAEADKETLRGRLPEDAKLRTYLADLRAVAVPELTNKDMRTVLALVLIKMDQLSDLIFDGTQGEG